MAKENKEELKASFGKYKFSVNNLTALAKAVKILKPMIVIAMVFAVFFNDEAKMFLGIFMPNKVEKQTKIIENKEEISFTSETVSQIIKNFHTEVVKLQVAIDQDAEENNEELKVDIRKTLNTKFDLLKDELKDELLQELIKELKKDSHVHNNKNQTITDTCTSLTLAKPN